MRLALVLPFLISTSAHASVDDDRQVWTILTTTGSLSGPLMFSGEAVARYSNDYRGIVDTEFAALLGYRFSPTAAAFAGYARVPIYPGEGRPAVIENRLREQINVIIGNVAGGVLSSRSLLEERRREQAAGTGLRFRQQLRYVHALHRGSTTRLVVWHESFVSLNSTAWGQQAGYNRMRNFIGLGLPLTRTIAGEFGYLDQYDIRRDAQDRDAHALAIVLSYGF